ncbi:hypothetical protein J31TS4_03450 [Paenibacillus sp. J31TS4]|nr:hypothetical protein J31TS4_03450 [Paenibacillus sp. J31TS4]
MTKAVNIPCHLLSLFLIIKIDNIVETIKEKAMKMKFNLAPPYALSYTRRSILVAYFETSDNLEVSSSIFIRT